MDDPIQDGLIPWLLEQIAVDEQLATWAAEQVGDAHWQQRNVRIVTVADRDREVADYAITECIDHMVNFDPARVLAECEAKRRIIDKLATEERVHNTGGSPGAYHWAGGRRSALREVAIIFAESYAALGRPGYQESWRPA